jgi:hypothetical protein
MINLQAKCHSTTEKWTNTPLTAIENTKSKLASQPVEVTTKILKDLKKKYEVLERKH